MELKFVDIGTHMDNSRNFIELFKSCTNEKLCIIIKLYKNRNKIFTEKLLLFHSRNIFFKRISLFQ